MLLTLKEMLLGKTKNSKSLARSRLHFVLVQDRTGLTTEEMASFKREMVSVIEKYFVIDAKAFDISYKREGDTSTLLMNSPVLVRRREDGRKQAEGMSSKSTAKARKKEKDTHKVGIEEENADIEEKPSDVQAL